jgi:PilZ domain
MSVQNERRAGGPRVPLHTLVEIGAGEGGSAAFEAESINVTTAGMHLKTAYLPEIGEPLICRFEGSGTEIIVHGEVAWRNEDSYGGDFGVRFLEMDQDSLDALQDIVGDPIAEQEAINEQPEPDSPQIVRGTRVRLHIEGLGSPMKARVRDGTRGEVMVGSNLEFLRVGRSVELENVDADANRPARIERVSVEVEPTSHVPQLIVALRYLDVADEPQAPLTTTYADDESDEPMAVEDEDDLKEEAYADDAGEDEAYDEQDDEEYDEDEEEGGEGRAAVVWSKVKQVGPKFAVVGSFARRWGGKAKDAMGDAVTVAKKKAAEKVQEHKDSKAPRRTTAPPPKGALRRDGTRARTNVVDSEEPEAPKKVIARAKKIPKRAAMIALMAVLLTVVGLGFARNALMSSGSEEETAKADDSSETMPAGALPAAEGADDPGDPPIVPGAMGNAAAPNAGAGLVANVPLFGPTPMSTAAPMAPMAAVPAPAVAAVTPPPGDSPEADEGDESDMGAMAAAVEDEGSDDEAAEPEDKPAASKKKSKKTASSAKSFGRGRVNNPVVLTLNMNRKIKGLRGVRRSDGFVVDVVGARSREPAAGLRRQDKRIASSKVVNSGSNAQLTIRFKSGVPNYRVQASGSTLRILIDGDKKTASSNASGRGKKRK